MHILVLNTGSSSIKYELFEAKGRLLRSMFEGHYDNNGQAITNLAEILKKEFKKIPVKSIDAVGHRVVHGGERYTRPVRITAQVISEIKKLSHLAPLHNPANLAGILACKKLFPRASQIAIFDTAFHHTMPEHAFLYGLPYRLYSKLGIRRYGFHGTSHQYVYEQARKKLGRQKTLRTVTCHLGNGCSIAAIQDGKVIDTSMGFTPLEGVPMGTRSGDIDPAIIFFLIHRGFTVNEVERLLNSHSGLKGISEISSDVRDLWKAYRKGPKPLRMRAHRALKLFAYRIAKYVGGYSAALKGLDCIVFTGGTGVGAWYLRKWILEYFPDFPRNRVLVIPTNEERKIAEIIFAMIVKT